MNDMKRHLYDISIVLHDIRTQLEIANRLKLAELLKDGPVGRNYAEESENYIREAAKMLEED